MKFLLGTITKPQGLRGEFRVKPDSLDLSMFKNLKEVFIENMHYEVEKTIPRSVFVIVKLKEFNTIQDIEKLRNKKIFYELSEDRELDKDEYFIRDILNSTIEDENGKIIGSLIDIKNYGSSDIFICKDKTNKEFMFPFICGVIKKFDKINKKVIIDAKKLSEIIVYED